VDIRLGHLAHRNDKVDIWFRTLLVGAGRYVGRYDDLWHRFPGGFFMT